jgi:hypothetical protein
MQVKYNLIIIYIEMKKETEELKCKKKNEKTEHSPFNQAILINRLLIPLNIQEY